MTVGCETLTAGRRGAKTLAEAGVGEGAMLLVVRNEGARAAAGPIPNPVAAVSPHTAAGSQQQQSLLRQTQRPQGSANFPLDFSSRTRDAFGSPDSECGAACASAGAGSSF